VSEVLEKDRSNADAWRIRSDIYDYLDDYKQAIADSTEYLKLRPDDYIQYSNRALDYIKNGDCDLAVRDATRAIQLSPTYGRAYSLRGRVYREKRRIDEAISDFTNAIRFDSNRPSAYIRRAECYAFKHDIDAALPDYNRAIEVAPDNPDIYGARADFYWNRAKYDKAFADLATAEHFHQSSYTRERLAWYYSTCPDDRYRDPGKAAEYIDAIISERPNDPPLWRTCGAVLASIGDFDGAIAWEEAFRQKIRSCGSDLKYSDERLAAYHAGRHYQDEPYLVDAKLTAAVAPPQADK
jgi:tetratricopeptide (TPR) repeat protein